MDPISAKKSPHATSTLRHFDAIQRTLLSLMVATILVPACCIGIYADADYSRRMAEASSLVDRMAAIAKEYTASALGMNRELSDRVLSYLSSDANALRIPSEAVRSRLLAFAARIPEISSIDVYGADGKLIASSSKREPSVHPSLDALAPDGVLKNAGATAFALGPSGDDADVDVLVSRSAAGIGPFPGVLVVALHRQYFQDFFQRLIADNRGLVIGLYRDDGVILARHPENPSTVVNGWTAEVADAIASSALVGRLRTRSAVDGIERLYAYRRIDDYPLYVLSGLPTSSVIQTWTDDVLRVSALAVVPLSAVWLLLLFSMKRLRTERRIWEQLQSEAARRQSAEESGYQLRRMGALGNLVANVAHDFNNLLMVVDANMELARRKQYNDLEKEVSAVQRATAGAQKLARRLMSVARKQPLKLECLDLARWLENAGTLIQTSVGEKVELRLDVPGDIGQVVADPVELEAAALNLAVNAKDAMPSGGRFEIHCKPLTVDRDDMGLPPGEYVEIGFKDTGAGMAPGVAKRAFEPLFTTKAREAGTGLGLAQVFHAAEHAGGTARLESQPDVGTTVWIYLPKCGEAIPEEEKIAAWEDDEKAAIEGYVFSVLLVEDNEEVAAGICAVLETFGCKVRHEGTADAAMRTLHSGAKFELVLSDIHMPGTLSGIDLAEHVRTLWPSQRIGLMTGYAEELDRARRLGVTILAKPFDINELKALVSRNRQGLANYRR